MLTNTEERIFPVARLTHAPVHKVAPIRMGLVSIYGSRNVGIRSISGSLRAAGINVETIFFKDLIGSEASPPTEAEYDLLINLLRDLKVNFAGLGIICSSCQSFAAEITNRIHEKLGIPVIWGGPHASLMPEDCLKYADMVCYGEGDKALVDLIKNMEKGVDCKEAPSIWSRSNGEIIRNEPLPLQNFDEVAYPDVFRDHKYFIEEGKLYAEDPFHMFPDVYATITSKGCQFHCTFCATNLFEEGLRLRRPGQVRQMSPQKVMGELRHVLETGAKVRMIEFMDDEFSYNPEWVEEFAQMYKKDINLPFWCMFHPHSVAPEIVKMLRSAGLFYVQMGLQSGSERIRKKILGRPEDDVSFRKSVEIIRSVGIIPKVDLIFDNPYDTEQDHHDAIEFLLSLEKPIHFHLLSLCYFPKTKLTERALRDGYITEDQVEGKSLKTFHQILISPEYNRPPSEMFWIWLTPLTCSRFVPRALVRYFVRHKEFFQKHLTIISCLSNTAHFLGQLEKGLTLLSRGLLTFSLIKNYARYIFKISA